MHEIFELSDVQQRHLLAVLLPPSRKEVVRFRKYCREFRSPSRLSFGQRCFLPSRWHPYWLPPNQPDTDSPVDETGVVTIPHTNTVARRQAFEAVRDEAAEVARDDLRASNMLYRIEWCVSRLRWDMDTADQDIRDAIVRENLTEAANYLVRAWRALGRSGADGPNKVIAFIRSTDS
jgi:hypothetical protein